MTAVHRRRLLLPVLALCGLALAGCGYQPLYGQRANQPGVAAQLAAVDVALIPGRTGQLLRNALEQRMERGGGGAAKAYTLHVTLDEQTEPVGVARDATVTRENVVLLASFSLYRGGDVVLSGESRAAAGYNVLAQHYATIVSERDSRERAVLQVADDITRRIAVFLGNRPGS